MRTFLQDLKYGVRMLVKKPGFTLIVVVTLALGIGGTTAIFSVVNAVLLRSLPFQDPEKLIVVSSIKRNTTDGSGSASYPDFADLRSQNTSFEKMSAFRSTTMTLTGGGEPERIRGARVSGNFFEALGVNLLKGRGFSPEEDKLDGPRVAVLSYGFWQRRFGNGSDISGRTMTLNGNSYTVIGVLPPAFKFPIEIENAEIYSPISLDGKDLMEQRGAHYLYMMGRLKREINMATAQTELATICSRLEQQYPDDNTGRIVRLYSLQERLVGDFQKALWILFGAVALVLLIACSNVANLLLSRLTMREKEIAIRTALGANRWRVAQQFLTESVLMSLLGGVLGLVLAYWAVELLPKFSPAGFPRLGEINIDYRVLGFTLFVSVLTGILFGLTPALKSSRSDLNDALKEGNKGAAGFGRHRMLGALFVVQTALALVLLIGAGLLLKSFFRLRQVNPGFTAENVLRVNLTLPDLKYDKDYKIVDFYQRLVEGLKTLPGVESVGASNVTPLSGNNIRAAFNIEEHPVPSNQQPAAEVHAITPDYLKVMKVPLIKGRGITEQDSANAPQVILINQTMARKFWGDENPIGQHIDLGVQVGDKEKPERVIVGIVGDVRHENLNAEPQPEMYVPHAQQPWSSMSIMIRTTNEPTVLSGAIRAQVKSLDPDQPVSEIKPFTDAVSVSIAQPRFYTMLLNLFAAIALILAAVGIYGVMSYSVTQRTHEIGVRMALGANRKDVLQMVIRRGMTLTVIGVVIGLFAAFALTRLMSGLLYEVKTTDPLIFLSIALLFILVALFACFIPALRATKVDPMIALRYE